MLLQSDRHRAQELCEGQSRWPSLIVLMVSVDVKQHLKKKKKKKKKKKNRRKRRRRGKKKKKKKTKKKKKKTKKRNDEMRLHWRRGQVQGRLIKVGSLTRPVWPRREVYAALWSSCAQSPPPSSRPLCAQQDNTSMHTHTAMMSMAQSLK